MAASNREVGISKTLTYEGGFTNNPHDPGGATNWGITIFDARLHWKPDATPADVKAMPKSVAIEIYRQKYWAKLGCDDRPSGPDVIEFDTGVNSGVARVAQWRKAIDQKLSPDEYVKAFAAKRLSFLHALKTWQFFGKGWGSRVADLEAFCVHLAAGASGKPAAPVLRKEAEKHAKRTIAHTTISASSTVSLPALPHDLTSLSGWVFVAVATVGILYFVWNAVHANHRANAFTDQLKKA
ncbi:MAG: glycoside hydrolase family 108 protein [Ktedonobacterales bacterium]